MINNNFRDVWTSNSWILKQKDRRTNTRVFSSTTCMCMLSTRYLKKVSEVSLNKITHVWSAFCKRIRDGYRAKRLEWKENRYDVKEEAKLTMCVIAIKVYILKTTRHRSFVQRKIKAITRGKRWSRDRKRRWSRTHFIF